MRISILVLVLVFAEIAMLITVGKALGIAPTLALVLLAMMAGVVLLRQQGTATIQRIRADLSAGRLPARSLSEGAVIAAAGLLLLLPGFISDAVGILLFIPAVRRWLWTRLSQRIGRRTGRQAPLQPAAAGVLELEKSEYAATSPRPETPWRPAGGPSDQER